MKYFVYFSASGNGDFIAKEMAEKGYQSLKVEMVKPFGKVGFFKILKYGFQATRKKKAKIKELNLELKEDDIVVIGSPIWNDRLSTPINAVLDQFAFSKETTGFILYPAGEDTKKSFKQIEKLGYQKQPVVVAHPLKKPERVKDLLSSF